MLERSKDIGSLVAAWRTVAASRPDARLVVIGRGALADLVERLHDDLPDTVEHLPEVAPQEIARRLDEHRTNMLATLQGIKDVVESR